MPSVMQTKVLGQGLDYISTGYNPKHMCSDWMRHSGNGCDVPWQASKVAFWVWEDLDFDRRPRSCTSLLRIHFGFVFELTSAGESELQS